MFDNLFLAYAKHEQEKEDVVQLILAGARNGDNHLSFQLDDDFSYEDIEYIKEEVCRRLMR